MTTFCGLWRPGVGALGTLAACYSASSSVKLTEINRAALICGREEPRGAGTHLGRGRADRRQEAQLATDLGRALALHADGARGLRHADTVVCRARDPARVACEPRRFRLRAVRA